MRMIKGKEETLKSIQATADELLKTADVEKKQEVKDVMRDINNQWDELTGLVEKRGNQLDEVLELSQKFSDLNKELTDNLRKIDKKSKEKTFSEVKAKPDEIKEQIQEFSDVVETFNACEPKMEQLEDASKTLLGFATDEDVGVIEEKLEDMKERYWNVEKKVKGVEEKQNNALELAEPFNAMKTSFDEWFDVAESEMNELDGCEDNETKQEKLKV